LPGKPDGISGGDVDNFYREGRIREIAEYCESDVVNTYRVWLRYELFRGRLSRAEFQASEASLVEFIKARGKPITRHSSCSVTLPWGLNEDRTSQRSTASSMYRLK
jgi:predicted PolB exonuclease-like 3'-5' exonuclease